jgi:hypothetical protein
MSFAIALVLMAAGSPNEPEVLDGICEYQGLPKSSNDLQVVCDAAVITMGAGSKGVLVQFLKHGSGSPVGFAGDAEGSDLSIARVYLRPRIADPASGKCRIFADHGVVQGISCLAHLGSKSVTANFRVQGK